ncbi:MAG: hypothetical protein Q8N23_30675 [Archangium sp.]|nr:hypothetical protein [Archangium sp.]MDP3575793.1 hypothetical protein [Archangium sp.]
MSSTALPCLALLFVSSAAFAAEAEAAVPGELEAELDGGVEEEEEDSSATSQVASFAVTKLKDSPAVVTVVSSQEIKSPARVTWWTCSSWCRAYFWGSIRRAWWARAFGACGATKARFC